MGDFNARTGTSNDFIDLDMVSRVEDDILPPSYLEDKVLPMRSNVDKHMNVQGQNLLDLCIESKLRIVNGRIMGDSLGYKTYYGPRGSSSIDFIIAAEELFNYFLFINVMPPTELSDHCVVWCGMKMKVHCNCDTDGLDIEHHVLPEKYVIDSDSQQKYVASLVDEESACLLQTFLQNIDNDSELDINSLSHQLTKIIQNAASKSCQSRQIKFGKKTKRFRKKWFNGNCLMMRKELRKLGKRLQLDSNNSDLNMAFHRLKKEYNKTLKLYKDKFFKEVGNQLNTLHETDPKLFWRTIDNLSDKGRDTSNPIKLSEWFNYLSDLYSEDNPNLNLETLEQITKGPLDYAFNCKEVKQGISRLKNNKQPGLDQVLNEFIKSGSNILLLPLVKLFNKILSSGTFPDAWNISLISFLPKNNDIYDCNNYRCLSLTSCLGKLFTSLLQNRLNVYMEENNLYNKFQAGFRPGYRTTDHIYAIKTILNKYIHKNKKKVYACFVDFSKAFDTVWRSGLYQKLLHLGIGGNFYNVVKHMYANSKFAVKKNNVRSKLGDYQKGVRQGDGLSPLLFNIYINDIDKIFDQNTSDPVVLESTQLNCLIYADDLLLLSESKEGLQSCLDSLQQYCDSWKLKLNIEKTKVMIFSYDKADASLHKFTFNGSEIEIVHKYKYLGIILHYNGNFKHAAEHMYQKSLKAIFSLKSRILDFEGLNNQMKLKLFDTLIRPILTYGSEIWITDYSIKDKTSDNLPFEKIHNRFCKYLLGVHKKSSNFAARLEFGRAKILNFINMISLKYIKRVIELPTTRLLKEVFEVDKSLHAGGHRSSYSYYHKVMSELNIQDLDEANVPQSILERYTKEVKTQLTSFTVDNKLHTYSKLYDEYSHQTYLIYAIPKSVTKELAKLRISAHDLLIERGRYFRPKLPREQRLCTECNEIEDELHFMLFCTKFKDLRASLLGKFACNIDLRPNTYEAFNIFSRLVNPTSLIETKAVCTYICEAMKIR